MYYYFAAVANNWFYLSLTNIVRQKVEPNKILDNPYSYIEFVDVINYLETTEGKRKAGNFKYANLGMGLLGNILEIVTEKLKIYFPNLKTYCYNFESIVV